MTSKLKAVAQVEPSAGTFIDRLIGALQSGLPLVPRPYAELAARLRVSETTVIAGLRQLLQRGAINRLGVVVRHRELGYTANGMVVWNIADQQVDAVGTRMGTFDFVTLCYQRPRRLPDWPYNLFCMIHGRRREDVERHVDTLIDALALDCPHEILFSSHCYKQRGARYRRQ